MKERTVHDGEGRRLRAFKVARHVVVELTTLGHTSSIYLTPADAEKFADALKNMVPRPKGDA